MFSKRDKAGFGNIIFLGPIQARLDCRGYPICMGFTSDTISGRELK